MSVLIICALISGLCTIYVISPIAMTHARTCYLLMLLIPAVSLGGFIAIGGAADVFTEQKQDQISSIALEETFLLQELDAKPDDVEALLQLSGVYISQEKFTRAITLLGDALDKNAGHRDIALQLSSAHFAQGLLFAEHKDKAKALISLREAQRIAPEGTPFLPDLRHFIGEIERME